MFGTNQETAYVYVSYHEVYTKYGHSYQTKFNIYKMC